MKNYRIEFYQEYTGERVIEEDGLVYHMDPISTEMFIWVEADSEQEAIAKAFDNEKERVFVFAMDEFIGERNTKSFNRLELARFNHPKLMTEEAFNKLV